jgi:hypothetical protein
MRTSLKKYQLGMLLLLLSVHTESFGAQNNAENPPPVSVMREAVIIYDNQDIMPADETGGKRFSPAGAQAAVMSDSHNVTVKGGAEDKSPSHIDKEKKEEEESGSDGHVFGYRDGYLHAALALSGEWTDNLYNTDMDKQENFLTRISPSVWLTWPRRHRRPVQLASDNTAPGGMQYSLNEYEVFNKYQVYLAGKMDIMSYSEDSELDHIENGVEALIQYQPKSRLTLHLLDKYSHSQDIFNITEATLEDNRVYDSNIFGAGVDWQFSDKFSVKIAYRNFMLMYEEDTTDFLDRADNGFDGAFSYDYSPKTSFFLGYQYLLAAYDEGEMPDNDNTYLNVGINWQATVKTSLMLKAGYQQVHYDYEDSEDDKVEDVAELVDDDEAAFNFEAQAAWQATQKSEFVLNSKYSIEQTDSENALNKTVFVARIGFGHRFTNRLRGDINFIYENSDYVLFDGGSRLDDRWYLKPQLQFALNKWLFASLYYSFDKKDSDFDELDYETNVFGIGVRSSF